MNTEFMGSNTINFSDSELIDERNIDTGQITRSMRLPCPNSVLRGSIATYAGGLQAYSKWGLFEVNADADMTDTVNYVKQSLQAIYGPLEFETCGIADTRLIESAYSPPFWWKALPRVEQGYGVRIKTRSGGWILVDDHRRQVRFHDF